MGTTGLHGESGGDRVHGRLHVFPAEAPLMTYRHQIHVFPFAFMFRSMCLLCSQASWHRPITSQHSPPLPSAALGPSLSGMFMSLVRVASYVSAVYGPCMRFGPVPFTENRTRKKYRRFWCRISSYHRKTINSLGKFCYSKRVNRLDYRSK